MGDDESGTQTVFELRKNRQARRRQHLENIQLSIAVLIIGSYFTRVGQQLAAINSVGWLTSVFVGISAMYVLSKSIVLTLRQFRAHQWLTGLRAATYTLYTVSATGYAVFLAVVVFDIQVSAILTYGVILAIAALALLVGFIFYIRNLIPIFTLVPGVDEEPLAPYLGLLLEEIATDYPETIEPGMELLPTGKISNSGVDAMMRDADGNRVAVQFKYRTYGLIPSDIPDFETEVEADRYVVAVNAQTTIRDRETFDERGIEILAVDPYAAFGVLSGVVEFIDRHTRLLGFSHLGLA